ncbi:helicase HerA domain-containing protein [Lichenibacterium dinghuense]|uniref:helicase HerA domain-containing protein n=1 Tax=Lichenibacterium dinghuense TaxID=2895977 RepID=UPI001F20538D|nr:DUF87 domain-containing protein [Lichenibacterium sp. 6Y81]
MTSDLAALERADFDWVRTLDSVWSDAEAVAGGPNEATVAQIAADLFRTAKDLGSRPGGRVMVGPPGVGKTHMVGRLRREVWAKGGWFVLLDVLGLQDFWRTAALSFVTALLHDMSDGRRQLEAVLAGVARRFNIEEQVETAFALPDLDPVKLVEVFQRVLPMVDRSKAMEHGDVFRAMCFLRSQDFMAASLAHAWLQGYDADPERRTKLGFFRPPPEPARIVAGLSWIMGIAGPTLVALDQIDGVIDASRLPGDDGQDGPGLAEVLAAGLVELHDVRHRGMTVLACLEESWNRLRSRGTKAFEQRLTPPAPVQLIGMNDRRAAAGLVAGRLAPAYAEVGHVPTYPTWPFPRAVIDAAASTGIMPRLLLMRCDAFRRDCLARGKVAECPSLIGDAPPPLRPLVDGEGFDLEAAKHRAEIPDAAAVEDAPLGRLLRDAFDLYALETPPREDTDIASKGDPEQRIPPLHGRLTFTYHAENDRERHVCYRGLPQTNAIAFGARLRAALTSSGISANIAGRDLVLARRGPIPGGPKTRELFDRFTRAGGIVIDPLDEDLRTFAALRDMRASAEAHGQRDAFEAWLRETKPLRATAFFKAAVPGDEPTARSTGSGPADEPKPEPLAPAPRPRPSSNPRAADPPSAEAAPEPAKPPPRPPRSPDDIVPVGRFGDGAPAAVRVDLLPRHTAILAGSGSGKTVLLRRVIEEAALLGVPAVVVDPNNDLSRLGDPWPERPAAFTAEDDAKAVRYARDVEVVVWTPGARAGNPLFLSVLPDFSAVRDDPDERDAAVEMAAEALGPLSGAKSQKERGVLYGALNAFARRGGGDLKAFIALLSDLPEDASEIGGAAKLAATLADGLRSAVATNPLLRVDGPVLDPATLFAGADPARTRVSVINLAALGSDAAREDFVNRLQMALFGWIKRNPSERGRLYAVDEAQTFLPAAGKVAASSASGRRLAAQARKYGLGLVVATQAPKGIDTQIVSNCTTQFFGRQSSPATIAGAAEMMAAKGGSAPDIGKLSSGQFYFATEGMGRPRRIEAPLCLTHHPANPPSPDEVVARAARTRAAD